MQQDELLRDAFARIKSDINSLSQRIEAANDNIQSLRNDINDARRDAASKDMVTQLDRLILQLQKSVYNKNVVDKHLFRINERIDRLSAIVDKREKAMGEIKEIKILRHKIEDLREKHVPRKELKELFNKINEDFLFLDKRLTEIEEQSFYVDDVEKTFASKEEMEDAVSSVAKDIKTKFKDLNQSIQKLREEVMDVSDRASKIDPERIERIETEILNIKGTMVLREDLQKISERLNDMSKTLLFEDKKLREEMAKKMQETLKKLESYEGSIRKLSRDTDSLFKMSENIATNEQIKTIRKEIKLMVDAIGRIQKNQKKV
ncbi:MAG: hypothetical protein QXK37_00015 [Candidatus Woesearchaeota archaeon]